MIKRIEIRGVHLKVDPKLYGYASKKIGKLDQYAPRRVRESLHAEVILKEEQLKTKKNCICEVVLHLPGDIITTKESTINIYAAVDIVEAKLKNQLKKYKDTHSGPRFRQRLISRFKHENTAS